VLHAAGFHAKKWAVDTNFAWSPADVRALAVAAGGKMLKWTEFLDVLKQSFIKADAFKGETGLVIDYARSGRFCSTGAKCKYQSGEKWTGDKKKK
jgi:hypothetical protein